MGQCSWGGALKAVFLPWFHPAATAASYVEPRAGGGRFSGYWGCVAVTHQPMAGNYGGRVSIKQGPPLILKVSEWLSLNTESENGLGWKGP